MDVMTFYLTRIKRKSKGSLSSKSRPLHFVLDGKRRRLLPVVGSGVLTDENTLPETVQNFFFVFFSIWFICRSHFGNILCHGEGVGCYVGEIWHQRRHKGNPSILSKLQICFAFFLQKCTTYCKQICTSQVNFKILKTFIMAKALVSKYFLHFQRNTRWWRLFWRTSLSPAKGMEGGLTDLFLRLNWV